MLELAQCIAAATGLLCLSFVFWCMFVRRELFNPMLYIVYGTFHWLVIGELGTLFLSEEYYEPRGSFPADVQLVAAIIICLSIVSGLVGFYAFAPKRRHITNWQVVPVRHRLAWLTLLVGMGSFFFLLKHIKTFTIDQAGFEYALKILPLTLPSIASAVLGAYLFYRAVGHHGRGLLIWLCGCLALLPLISANVMVIFALFAIIFWHLNRNGKVYKAPLSFVVLLAALAPVVVMLTLTVKILQRPDDFEAVFTFSKLIEPATQAEAIHRFVSLDIFNVENYGLFLTIIEQTRQVSDLRLGSSYLAALLPFLRFFDPNIRGMGRQLAIEEGFGDVNVSFATPPIVELYANFGLLAPVVGYFVAGSVMAYLYRWFMRSRYECHGIIYFFVLTWVFFIQRGDALNTVLYPAYIFFVMVALLWLSGRQTAYVIPHYGASLSMEKPDIRAV